MRCNIRACRSSSPQLVTRTKRSQIQPSHLATFLLGSGYRGSTVRPLDGSWGGNTEREARAGGLGFSVATGHLHLPRGRPIASFASQTWCFCSLGPRYPFQTRLPSCWVAASLYEMGPGSGPAGLALVGGSGGGKRGRGLKQAYTPSLQVSPRKLVVRAGRKDNGGVIAAVGRARPGVRS